MDVSTSSYRLLVLCLLFLCLQLCVARRLATVETKLDMDHNHSSSTKHKPRVLLKEKADVTRKGLDETQRTDKIDKFGRSSGHGEVGFEDGNAKIEGEQRGKRASSDATASSKRVSRPWKVPQKKKGPREEHPGFNLDYMQPSTHPPHHN
ncbi:PREDICTED: uncharacterized protein LOC104817222 [Tarenaya hassleriana]|uniref:uncharacterized protein LOC104817222 n=1 Tax=Tarenaya hassleriana TaxID=28532 RepID=UPI00053C58DE|nr:PREDICTED: uncharacterized protein LOC104817222 [Tarenaya hassleriana]